MTAPNRGLALSVVLALVASLVLACGSSGLAPTDAEVPAPATEELAEAAGTAQVHTPTEPAPTKQPATATGEATHTPEPSAPPLPTDTPPASNETPTETATVTATLAPGQPPTPSSRALIRQALDEGEIGEEAALVYEVFASFADKRLPEEYRGDDSRVIDSHAVARAVERWDSLSPETRQILTPFRLPPNAPGSWWELREAEARAPGTEGPSSLLLASSAGAPLAAPRAQYSGWKYVWAVQDVIKVWYYPRLGSPAAQIANDLAQEIGNHIYPCLAGLMQRALLSDEYAYCIDRFKDPLTPQVPGWCTGDDGAVDIYLVQGLGTGKTIPYESCENAPSFVQLDLLSHQGQALWSLAEHELMHVFQYTYNNCDEYDWISEATAVWAQDFGYPGDQAKWPVADYYLKRTQLPISHTDGTFEYGAYLFFFFLTHRAGGTDDVIREVWQNTEKPGMNKHRVVDEAIGGDGFDSVWHEFALCNWNQPPYDCYQRWDRMGNKAEAFGKRMQTVISDGVMRDQMGMGSLSDLSITYMYYSLTEPDPRLVTVFNGLTWELKEKEIDLVVDGLPIQDGSKVFDWKRPDDDFREGLRVQALYRIRGERDWRKAKDLTDLPYISFCCDAAAERLEELVVIYSSAKFDSGATSKTVPEGLQPALLGSNIGCWRWEGHSKSEIDAVDLDDGSTAMMGTLSVPRVVWEREKAFPDIPYPYITFNPKEGDWEWEAHSTSDCQVSGSDAGALETKQLNNMLHTFYGVTSGRSQRRYQGMAVSFQYLPVKAACPCPPRTELCDLGLTAIPPWQPWYNPSEWLMETDGVLKVQDSGSQIRDQVETSDGYRRTDWQFEAKRE